MGHQHRLRFSPCVSRLHAHPSVQVPALSGRQFLASRNVESGFRAAVYRATLQLSTGGRVKMEPAEAQLAQTAQAIARNLDALLAVCGDRTGMTAKKMSDAELNRITGLHRDRIKALREAHDEKGPTNCDLQTICRIAAAFAIPPALLLMTPNDWTDLLAAIEGLHGGALDPRFDAQLREPGAVKAEVGLRIAFALGYRPERVPDQGSGVDLLDEQQKVQHRNQAKARAILGCTAMTQSAVRYPRDLLTLSAIGAYVGASRKPISQGDQE